VSFSLKDGLCRCDICGLELHDLRVSIALCPDPNGPRYALPGDFCRGSCKEKAERLWLDGWRAGVGT